MVQNFSTLFCNINTALDGLATQSATLQVVPGAVGWVVFFCEPYGLDIWEEGGAGIDMIVSAERVVNANEIACKGGMCLQEWLVVAVGHYHVVLRVVELDAVLWCPSRGGARWSRHSCRHCRRNSSAWCWWIILYLDCLRDLRHRRNVRPYGYRGHHCEWTSESSVRLEPESIQYPFLRQTTLVAFRGFFQLANVAPEQIDFTAATVGMDCATCYL